MPEKADEKPKEPLTDTDRFMAGYAGKSAMQAAERDGVLAQIPETGWVLEVGTLCGVSVSYWARNRPCVQFVSLDPFVKGTGTGPGNEAHWRTNAQSNQQLIIGKSCNMALQKSGAYLAFFDVVIIDGDHHRDWCFFDCVNAHWLVKPSGKIIVHDYGREEKHLLGVTQAVDRFCLFANYEITARCKTLVVLKRKAPTGA